MKSTAPPTQVTTHTHNSTDTDIKNNYKEENGGERGDGDGDDTIDSFENIGLGYVSIHVEESVSILSSTTDNPPPPHPTAREIHVNGVLFQITKMEM